MPKNPNFRLQKRGDTPFTDRFRKYIFDPYLICLSFAKEQLSASYFRKQLGSLVTSLNIGHGSPATKSRVVLSDSLILIDIKFNLNQGG